jgi:hypothetical protein
MGLAVGPVSDAEFFAAKPSRALSDDEFFKAKRGKSDDEFMAAKPAPVAANDDGGHGEFYKGFVGSLIDQNPQELANTLECSR